jgi:hypothetical protein
MEIFFFYKVDDNFKFDLGQNSNTLIIFRKPVSKQSNKNQDGETPQII